MEADAKSLAFFASDGDSSSERAHGGGLGVIEGARRESMTSEDAAAASLRRKTKIS